MPKLIEAQCPGCGGNLKVPEAVYISQIIKCNFCGREVILSRDDLRLREKSIKEKCSLCGGSGSCLCMGIENIKIKGLLRSYELFAESCSGTGKCLIYSHPEKKPKLTNYCSNGKCAWCRGTGRFFLLKCRFCEGTGDCRFCYGTGVCKICNGRGIISCKRCKGTGVKR